MMRAKVWRAKVIFRDPKRPWTYDVLHVEKGRWLPPDHHVWYRTQPEAFDAACDDLRKRDQS